jgi:alkylation response protein AidB-like acyl-CoA dehydrogenase
MPDRQATCQNEPRHFVRHAPMTDPSQTDEQQMIRDAVARFLDRAGGLAPARRIADVGPGRDMALWSGMVGELGLSGIVLPAAEGGLGLGMTELVLIQAELGRRLAPVPFLSTVGIAGAVLSHACDGPAPARLRAAIAAGTAILAVAVSGDGADDPFAATSVIGRPVPGGWSMTGRTGPVVDLPGADAVLVPALVDGSPALFALTTGTGLVVTPLDPVDRTRPAGRLDLDDHRVDTGARLDPGGGAAELRAGMECAMGRARLALAAEAAGAAFGAFDATLAYIGERRQFGRTIASFQAVKHRLADLFVRLHTAWSMVLGAAGQADGGADPALAAAEARAAHAVACEALHAAAAEAIQLHGGVGMTWEYDPHLFFKRALAVRHHLGRPETAFDALGAALLAGPLSAMPDADDGDPFRVDVAGWMRRHLAGRFAPLVDRGGAGDGDALPDLRKEWERALAAGGWVGIGLPPAAGGRGMPVARQVVFHEEYARAGGPGRMGHIGEGLVAPTLVEFGTAEQKARFLPGILEGRTFWAQGYSEPGAGSDLAAIRTRARRDPASGDWIVDGHKIWTSLAHVSDWIFVLARAVEGSVGRQGLILLLMPLDQPGITVRPIRQINGGAEFNEVFLDGARAAADDAVGAPGDGWAIATRLLAFERGISTLGQQMGFARELDAVVRIARDEGTGARPHIRERLGRAWAGLRAMRHGARRTLGAQERGAEGAEVLGHKYEWSNWHRALGELAMEAMGPAATVADTDPVRARLQAMHLFSRAETIYGGTNEIQLNIIAEQGLRMPREPRGDQGGRA